MTGRRSSVGAAPSVRPGAAGKGRTGGRVGPGRARPAGCLPPGRVEVAFGPRGPLPALEFRDGRGRESAGSRADRPDRRGPGEGRYRGSWTISRASLLRPPQVGRTGSTSSWRFTSPRLSKRGGGEPNRRVFSPAGIRPSRRRRNATGRPVRGSGGGSSRAPGLIVDDGVVPRFMDGAAPALGAGPAHFSEGRGVGQEVQRGRTC